MANHRDIVPFFIKWEGGLSRNPNDSASSHCCPTPHPKNGLTDYHTNKGVTYSTFVHYFGYDNDDMFYEMNSNFWGIIFKSGYWDKVKGDSIKHQSIANTLVSWAWGSGSRTAIKEMQRVLGVTVDGWIGKQTIGAINEADECELFDKCLARREWFFRTIAERRPKNRRFLKGWLNRLNDFNEKYQPCEK